MKELVIKIKINNTAFLVDMEGKAFRGISDPGNIVLFEECTYRYGKWYVLWNKRDNNVFAGLRKIAMPPYVSEVCIDFLDAGKFVRHTILQTIVALTDTIIHLLMKYENNGTIASNNVMYN